MAWFLFISIEKILLFIDGLLCSNIHWNDMICDIEGVHQIKGDQGVYKIINHFPGLYLVLIVFGIAILMSVLYLILHALPSFDDIISLFKRKNKQTVLETETAEDEAIKKTVEPATGPTTQDSVKE